MTISPNQFIDEISALNTEVYLLFSTEILVYDYGNQIIYIPVTTHGNTSLNRLGDFRTHVGHWILWSRHVEVECSSEKLREALIESGFNFSLYGSHTDYAIYSITK